MAKFKKQAGMQLPARIYIKQIKSTFATLDAGFPNNVPGYRNICDKLHFYKYCADGLQYK